MAHTVHGVLVYNLHTDKLETQLRKMLTGWRGFVRASHNPYQDVVWVEFYCAHYLTHLEMVRYAQGFAGALV